MQYMARLLLVMGICWVWLLAGCTDSPRYLMDQAERAFIASFDSVDFYLSQIEHPEKLAPKEQLRYAYLKGKIEFYTLGSQSDSLLLFCRKQIGWQSRRKIRFISANCFGWIYSGRVITKNRIRCCC